VHAEVFSGLVPVAVK